MFEARPLRAESLGERLAEELRRGIIVGEIADGTRLVEEDLAASFRVSRGPVRDAVKILRAEGLVTGLGRNVTTRSLSSADIDELMALRASFEVLALERAMASDRPELVRQLNSALAQMDTAAQRGDTSSFTSADIHFHASFFNVAGMTRLNLVWNQFRPTIEGLLDASGKRLDDLEPSAREHHDLAQLIAAGKVAKVRADLQRHLQTTSTRLQSAVSPPD